MAITLKSVAERVDCDVSTVSRVLNDKPNRVCPETRRKILKAARDLGYTANLNARSLASGRTGTIGMMVRNLTDTIYSEYVELIDENLLAQDYSILPFLDHEKRELEERHLQSLARQQVDAMILTYYDPLSTPLYQRLKKAGHTLVFRNVNPNHCREFDQVQVDIVGGYYHLCNHLFAQGCRRIGIVGGYIADEIHAGRTGEYSPTFRQAHAETGLAVDPSQAIPCANSQEAAYAAVKEALTRAPGRLDALLVQNPHKVLGVYRAVQELGLRIPDTIKLCTIGDLDLCRMLPDPITVWSEPRRDICRALVQLTLDRIAHPEAALRTVSFRSELVVRRSTGGSGL